MNYRTNRIGLTFVSLIAALLGPACALHADPAAVQAYRQQADESIAKGPYKADWESLKAHKDPDWFRDAKFGIYTHWGPVTLGADGAKQGMEWYGREMYMPSHPAFAYHRQRFGDQKTVGYKDIFPKFTAEKFNADEWADLFARAGAKFAGPVAVHHDNFAMWDSQVTRWNAKATGPKRDTTGELEKAIKKRGMKFITTFHHGFAWEYYLPALEYDAADGKNFDLYAEPRKKGDKPTQRYLDQWLAMVQECVTKYQPDLIWYDFELGRVIPPEYQQRMFAWYYNWGEAQHIPTGVAMKHKEIHQYTGILDFERGREDQIKEYVWLTDSALGPWFHHDCIPYRSLDSIVDVLVDIVSKNGCLLLNVGPRADGSLPDKAKEYLIGIGDWLKINGDAIYATRPWQVYGEGPTHTRGGGFSENKDRPFTAEDIRFTVGKDGSLYAIVLDWPASGKVVIASLAQPAGQEMGKISRVEMLGHAGELKFARTAAGLEVEFPASKPCDFAFALKITGENLKAVPQQPRAQTIRPAADGSIALDAEGAQIHGFVIDVEQKNGRSFLGRWDHANEWVSWPIEFPAAGEYNIAMICSSAKADVELKLELAGQKLLVKAPRTDGWFNYATVSAGKIRVDKAGVQELAVRPASAERWKAVNIQQIKLTKAP